MEGRERREACGVGCCVYYRQTDKRYLLYVSMNPRDNYVITIKTTKVKASNHNLNSKIVVFSEARNLRTAGDAASARRRDHLCLSPSDSVDFVAGSAVVL
jgi:hypothetical protein